MKATVTSRSIAASGLLAVLVLVSGTALTGCLTDDGKDSGAKSDSTLFGAETMFMVGAQANTTLGTAVDLDSKKALLSDDAKKAQGTIDLLFVYSGDGLQIASPVAAKEAGDVPLAAAYDNAQIHDTQIARISTPPETSEIAATTYAATPKTNMTYALDGGEYLVKTDKGKIVYLRIDSIAGTDNTASAKFHVALSGL
jgi:hypothetical protein